MIGLDTNALIRLMIDDDRQQAESVRAAARAVIAGGGRLFINKVVLVEFVWVVSRIYKRSRMETGSYLGAILNNDDMIVEDADLAIQALELYNAGVADFPDALIAAGNRRAGCSTTLTFDRRAARLPEFQLPA